MGSDNLHVNKVYIIGEMCHGKSVKCSLRFVVVDKANFYNHVMRLCLLMWMQCGPCKWLNKTKMPFSLQQTTCRCVNLVALLRPWPMTFVCDLDLVVLKMCLHTKNEACRSRSGQSKVRTQIGQTDFLAAVTYTCWSWHKNLTYRPIFWRRTCILKMSRLSKIWAWRGQTDTGVTRRINTPHLWVIVTLLWHVMLYSGVFWLQ